MEKKKTSETKGFQFDLEKDLSSMEKRAELAKRIETRIHEIKKALHEGSRKEDYEKLGVLLNGYHALAVVLSRICQEPKRKK